ncbi:MAG: AraC family transcriptional regulator [Vagococcus sp.]|jgi:AraC-like DNA-binding protein/mannose-6-phosphate isomerase-like protein (cupin superfamily)|nr:AraC family transcriptional regulator [Vagococcus sp.]
MTRRLPINIDEKNEEHFTYQSVGFSIIPYTIDYQFERNDFMPLHWHKELQISWVFEGSLEFLIDSESVEIGEKELLFINRNKLHSSTAINQDAKTLCINFDLDFLHPKIVEDYIDPVLNNSNFSYYTLPLVGTFSKYLQSLLKDISTEENQPVKETKSTNYFQVVTLINLIIEEIVVKFDQSNQFVQSEDNYLLNELLAYIHQNYQQKIKVDDLAKEAHISKTLCNQLFIKYTKMSPIQYVTAYRLQIAQQLVITTEDSISDISEHCGFATTSYFVEQFRKQYKLSPLKFRKKFSE